MNMKDDVSSGRRRIELVKLVTLQTLIIRHARRGRNLVSSITQRIINMINLAKKITIFACFVSDICYYPT